MVRQTWIPENRKLLICVDTYDGSIPEGRLYSHHQEMESFSGLTQLLLRLDELLDEQRQPQAYTEPRRFTSLLPSVSGGEASDIVRRGGLCTFELKVLFRQHSSWQGTLRWREKDMEQSFRSVLELIFLMDSALRSAEGGALA